MNKYVKSIGLYIQIGSSVTVGAKSLSLDREREIKSFAFPFQRPVACYYVRFPVKNSDVGLNIIDSNNQQGC